MNPTILHLVWHHHNNLSLLLEDLVSQSAGSELLETQRQRPSLGLHDGKWQCRGDERNSPIHVNHWQIGKILGGSCNHFQLQHWNVDAGASVVAPTTVQRGVERWHGGR